MQEATNGLNSIPRSLFNRVTCRMILESLLQNTFVEHSDLLHSRWLCPVSYLPPNEPSTLQSFAPNQNQSSQPVGMCVLLHVILNGTHVVFLPIGMLGKPLTTKCERRLLVQWQLLSMQRDQFTQKYIQISVLVIK